MFLLSLGIKFLLGVISTATDKNNQLNRGLKKVNIEENNSHTFKTSQNNILNKQSECLKIIL